MAQYVRRLSDVPSFSDIPLPGHGRAKVKNRILMDPVTGSQSFMLLWAESQPGGESQPHTHASDQAYYTLKGRIWLRIDRDEFTVEPNTAVLIPAGVEHELKILGDESFQCLLVFAPPVDSFANRPH